MLDNTVFNLLFLKEQLKIISEKRAQYETGKYFVSFNFSIEQKALTELLLHERIKELETLNKFI